MNIKNKAIYIKNCHQCNIKSCDNLKGECSTHTMNVTLNERVLKSFRETQTPSKKTQAKHEQGMHILP